MINMQQRKGSMKETAVTCIHKESRDTQEVKSI